jgi:hypothetical protein
LLNSFLDSLLYNFLAKARGTSLAQLKPAIVEVLKAKLARDALASADEELEGLVGDADVDEKEDITTSGGQEAWSQDWHLEMAFKRMRLRVMVFIRLGDFDDEDEEKFLDEEDDLRNSEKPEQEDMLASPAAVYLAGVLEYIAERALSIAGDAAFKRASGQTHRRVPSDVSEVSDGTLRSVVVQDADVEKITLNSTLGRLWRKWRKNYRIMHATSGSGNLMPYAPPSPTADKAFHARLGSLNEIATTQKPSREELENRHLSADEIPEGDVLESDIAANIPLPMNENDVEEIEKFELPDEEIVAAIPLPMGSNDVNEIEVPGLANEITDDEVEKAHETAAAGETPRRPLSAILSWLTPFSWAEERPKLQRVRSISVPNRERPAFLGTEVFTPAVEQPEPVAASVEAEPVSGTVDTEPAQQTEAKDIATVESSKVDVAQEEGLPSASEIRGDEAPRKLKEENGSRGIIAGAVAGATALVGTAAAVVIGSSQTEQPKGEQGAEEAQKLEAAQVSKAETEKPKSPVSNSIADRRRMFEAQTKSASEVDSPVHREVSPAPPHERKTLVAPSPPERTSSLEKRNMTAAGVIVAATASVSAAAEAEEATEAPRKDVDPRVDGKTAAEEEPASPERQVVNDEKAIGVARTSDVPVPYPRSTQSTSPPPERQRSYHLPSNQSSQTYQGKNESGRTTPSDRNASKDRTLVGADEHLLNRHHSGSKSGPASHPAATNPDQGARQNGATHVSHDAPQGATFYHSESEDKLSRNEQSARTVAAETTKHRPPPLQMATRDTEPADTSIRPTSAARSIASISGGHSTKGSASSSTMQRHLDKKSLEESRQRDFDSLLKNDEPVKYTLTPEDLRTTEVRSPAATSLASALADRGPPSPRIISSPTVYTARRAPPRDSVPTKRDTPSPTSGQPAGGRKPGVPRVSEYKRAAAHRLSQRPELLNTGSRRSGFVPREPRVRTDNTADLADYMSSTAPAHEQPMIPLVRSTSNSKLQNGARTSSPLPRAVSRQKLVAREPDVKEDGTSDLIDFIRQGPPGSKPEKEQRRTVAPFRSTMDSDDLNMGDFASSVHTSLGSNRNSGSTSTRLSSRAGLLGNSSSNRGNFAASAGPSIVKKQHRAKDPYAIDSDDEDDSFLTALPDGRAVQEPKEESLADFLRNSEPPLNNAPQLLNGAASNSKYMNGSSAARLGSRTAPTGYNVNLVPNSSRSAMINSGMSTDPTQKSRFEARAAGATRNGFGGNGFYYSTNDMADFLRSSGPVENMAPTPQVPLQKKPSKRLGS